MASFMGYYFLKDFFVIARKFNYVINKILAVMFVATESRYLKLLWRQLNKSKSTYQNQFYKL